MSKKPERYVYNVDNRVLTDIRVLSQLTPEQQLLKNLIIKEPGKALETYIRPFNDYCKENNLCFHEETKNGRNLYKHCRDCRYCIIFVLNTQHKGCKTVSHILTHQFPAYHGKIPINQLDIKQYIEWNGEYITALGLSDEKLMEILNKQTNIINENSMQFIENIQSMNPHLQHQCERDDHDNVSHLGMEMISSEVIHCLLPCFYIESNEIKESNYTMITSFDQNMEKRIVSFAWNNKGDSSCDQGLQWLKRSIDDIKFGSSSWKSMITFLIEKNKENVWKSVRKHFAEEDIIVIGEHIQQNVEFKNQWALQFSKIMVNKRMLMNGQIIENSEDVIQLLLRILTCERIRTDDKRGKSMIEKEFIESMYEYNDIKEPIQIKKITENMFQMQVSERVFTINVGGNSSDVENFTCSCFEEKGAIICVHIIIMFYWMKKRMIRLPRYMNQESNRILKTSPIFIPKMKKKIDRIERICVLRSHQNEEEDSFLEYGMLEKHIEFVPLNIDQQRRNEEEIQQNIADCDDSVTEVIDDEENSITE